MVKDKREARNSKNEEMLRNAIGNLKPQIQVVENPKQAKKLENVSSSTKIKENIVVKKKQGVKDFINSWQIKILNKSTEPFHRKEKIQIYKYRVGAAYHSQFWNSCRSQLSARI